jgi:hypothetical protein
MIIKTFNLTYFLFLFLILLITVILSILFKNKSQKAKDTLIISVGVFNVLLFIVYKYFLSIDGYDFVIWKEFPLQLCNINMFIIPLGVILNNKYLKTFGFYVGPLAALMAITFPEEGFTDNSILLMRNVGFYGTHGIIVIMGLLLLTLNYIELKFKDIISLLAITIPLSLSISFVNMLFYKFTGVETNYFFTMHPSTVSLLHLFYNLIPIKYLYLLPAAGILIVYVIIINSIKLLYLKIKG